MKDFKTYNWQGYRCAYDRYSSAGQSSPYVLLTIHPVGVGLSRHFWDRFCQYWQHQGRPGVIYNADLLGCGDSDRPRVAYYPEDWADQLQHLIMNVIQQPVVLLVQGALLPVALELIQRTEKPNWLHGLVLAGPPGWPLITQTIKSNQPQFLWNLFFDTPIGNAFFRYARREQFLQSFSKRQLFACEDAIDQQWLHMLAEGAGMDNRHAVFSFLAGFWRQDYTPQITSIQQPTLVLFGQQASGIDRVSRADDAQKRLQDYLRHLPNGEGELIPGRNVLPYESTAAFTDVLDRWLMKFV